MFGKNKKYAALLLPFRDKKTIFNRHSKKKVKKKKKWCRRRDLKGKRITTTIYSV